MRIIDRYPIIVNPKFRQCRDFWGQQNPDPANRHRPTLGLPVLIGMQSTGPDSWAGRIRAQPYRPGSAFRQNGRKTSGDRRRSPIDRIRLHSKSDLAKDADRAEYPSCHQER
jgi:hypothetical protein